MVSLQVSTGCYRLEAECLFMGVASWQGAGLKLFSPCRCGAANLAAVYSKQKNPNKSYDLQCCLGTGRGFGAAITFDSRRVVTLFQFFFHPSKGT